MTVGEVQRAAPGESLGLRRGEAAVCIPVYEAHDLFVQCLGSVLEHTPTHITILVADDSSADPATGIFLDDLSAGGTLRHRLVYLRQPRNVGFVVNVNTAFETLAPADVVVVNSDVIVGSEWLDRMRDAAYCETNIATATALTNHGTILSVPNRNEPQTRLPDDTTVDDVARRVARSSPRIRPRIPTAIGHCTYIRRDALELVGDFDEAFSPGYGEEVDLSQRCVARGLSHVAADDVFVFHRGEGSFGRTALREQHEEIIGSRYPYYADAVRATALERTGPLPRALRAARAAIRPLSVTIDARFLGRTITGTQVQAMELIHALSKTRKADLRVVIPPALGERDRSVLDHLSGVECVEATNFLGRGAKFAPTDVVHRPTQLFSWSDFDLIPRLGDRFVVTQLDLIAYRNPTYSRSYAEWNGYRQLTRLTLALADCVVFMSEHPARDAIADELVDERRSRVVHLGVDHHVSVSSVARRPERVPESADANFVLCLGTNFRHKNRTFALQLLEALQDRHGWDGWLIFAGPGAASGTSASDEAAFLGTRPGVAGRVADLNAVTDDEKLWLLREARGVVFPSTYEGFGLVPFEAAEQGTPCFHACQTSLGDILPERSATLVPWNAAESADAIVPALQDGEAARALTELVVDAGRKLTWARAADAMLDVYSGVIHAPNREVARVADVRLPVSLSAFRSAESEGLVDLSPDAYRAVYGLAMNHLTGPAFLALARALYATGHFLRRGRRPSVEDAV